LPTDPGNCQSPLFFPFPSLVLRVAGLVLLGLAGTGAAHAQISPGPLSRAHQFLSGATQCTSCHKIAGKAEFKCLECHGEIAQRLAAGRGLHATYGQDCVRCHSEHNGENFPLIRWNPSPQALDHSKTGYPLEGKHAGLACNRCHTAEHVAASERASIKVKDLNRTLLGVPRTCTTCHQDAHQGRLGAECQQCHSVDDWKKVSRFDHSRTRYPLTGLHAQVACQKCHQPGPDGQVKYTGLAFDRCNACHSDPHRATMEGACQSCHNTRAWKAVSMETVNEKFDHSRTAYPLRGKHAELQCGQCHANGDFKQPIAFQKCADCHKPDPHGGQFLKRADGGECASCHTVDGFKPARFGLPEHTKTAYPLGGKHTAVACAKCHIPAGRATLYKIKFAKCTDCHSDNHQGQFAAAPHFNRCQDCHSVQAYRPAEFALAQHKKTRFPLVGAHLAVPCGDCHKAATTAALKNAALFRFDDRSCTACHSDPHRGQFAQRMQARRADGSAAGCEACHAVTTWKDLTAFDHATTAFALQGAHRGVACADCHRPPNLEVTLMNADFRAAPHACESCHEDPHGKQFAREGATRCAECHDSGRWKPSLFDHDTRTLFPLQGAHKGVRCARCHGDTRTIEGRSVLFYKPTPRECAACHGPEIKTGGRP
jgi:hypothetical protein